MKTVVIPGAGSAMGAATPERLVQGGSKAIGVGLPGKGTEISGNLSMHELSVFLSSGISTRPSFSPAFAFGWP